MRNARSIAAEAASDSRASSAEKVAIWSSISLYVAFSLVGIGPPGPHVPACRNRHAGIDRLLLRHVAIRDDDLPAIAEKEERPRDVGIPDANSPDTIVRIDHLGRWPTVSFARLDLLDPCGRELME